MATLVLTTVGRLVGGPIGGLVGALVGQRVDQAVFGPKGRQGPRLGELSVQTSSYGTALPRIFGTMRVAGTVIWATDLREERHRSGGKGRARTTSYSYSASFAVALSARPIRAVGRVWADGNLLRGAAGDWKTELGAFRLHLGGEDQAVDPLIASAEGSAPAYRGLAYAVFEDLQLADYGNRIPSLSFEVEADAGPVSIGAIAGALGDGLIAGEALAALEGYAATGDSVIGAIATLATIAPLSLFDDGERLLLSAPAAPVAMLSVDELGATTGGERSASRREMRGKPPPGEVSIAYYEPARDHQAGLQRARRPGGGLEAERIELPAGLDAGTAKAIAERRLARAWTNRTRRTVTLPFARANLRPGQLVSFAGESGSWRIAETTLERMVVEMALVRHRAGAISSAAAEPGRVTGAPDLVHGATVLRVFELPDLSDDASGRPSLRVAAAGTSPGWRRAALSLSLDGGASWRETGATAAPAVIGTATTLLASGQPDVFDSVGAIEVTLLHGGMALEDADDSRLIAGANLALIGDELVQFGSAVPLDGARWRLSRLVRGRRGTEWAIAGHAVGERFVLIEAEALVALDVAASGAARVMATGLGDAAPVLADHALAGVSVRPSSPVRLHATPLAGGGFALAWTRRSRAGWRWIDGVDAPLGEERELYRLTVMRAGAVVREIELAEPLFEYGAATLAADAGGASSLAIDIVQVGSWAASLPARLTLNL